jgi:CPA1 family monovalent cation:H+ antiporter
VLEIRSSGAVPSEIVADVLALLDVEESMLDIAGEEREEIQRVTSGRRVGDQCEDLVAHPVVEIEGEQVCEQCIAEGYRWVSLRKCLICGQVGCCDSSPKRHATAHFRATEHRVIQSAEPGEDWRWCYVHHLTA